MISETLPGVCLSAGWGIALFLYILIPNGFATLLERFWGSNTGMEATSDCFVESKVVIWLFLEDYEPVIG